MNAPQEVHGRGCGLSGARRRKSSLPRVPLPTFVHMVVKYTVDGVVIRETVGEGFEETSKVLSLYTWEWENGGMENGRMGVWMHGRMGEWVYEEEYVRTDLVPGQHQSSI